MNSTDWYELYHFGVPGQKKGVRRWQNPDGSLTPEGRIHYGVKGTRSGREADKVMESYNKEGKYYHHYTTEDWPGSKTHYIEEYKGDLKNLKNKSVQDERIAALKQSGVYFTKKAFDAFEAGIKHSSIDDDFLAHFGIKGQKKGVRRYQYPDGSLTPAGYTHYGYKGRGTRSSKEAEDVVKALNNSGEYARKTTSNGLLGTKYYIERVPDNDPDYMKIQDRMEQQERVTKALARISSEKMKEAKEKNVYDMGFLEVYDQDDKPKSDKEVLKEYENYLKNPSKWFNKMSLPENFRSQPNSKFSDFENDIYGDMESHIKDKNSGSYGHMSVRFNKNHTFSKADISKVMSNIEKYRAEVKNELNGFKIPGHNKPINSKDVGYFHLEVNDPIKMRAAMQYLGSYEGIDNPLIYFAKRNGKGKWIYDGHE